MKHHLQPALCLITVAALLLGGTPGRALTQGQRSAPAPLTQQAWTLGEALAQLALYPDDAYLQYVALQLARRQNRLEEIAGQIKTMIERTNADIRTERTNNVDLFSIFTGALAVQESLQLDTMRGNTSGGAVITQATNTNTSAAVNAAVPETTPVQPRRRNRRSRRRSRQTTARTPTPMLAATAPVGESSRRTREEAAAQEKRRREIVQVSSLQGPTIKSHPWEQMLAGRKPEISALARLVPEDFYLVEFRSLGKLLQAMDAGDLWGTHLFNQAYREARTQQVGERLKRQLALETEPVLRPFYDLVVKEVAVTGSDPFAREGSDVTILFQVKQPEIFKARMESFLVNAEKAHADAKRSTGQILGVDYVQLETPDRAVSVFAADPAPDLHVRSNSRVALERVIEAVKGQTRDGRAVRRLGESAEFAYIRTLLPLGAREEDGLVYLSDPFIRRLVGPQLKLTERRRMLCYNHLRMIGHAALLYRTERGAWPTSLAALAEANTSPGLFNEGELSCPDGGKYSLTADGMSGVCSRHGRAEFMTPNLEIPVTSVTGAEADEYKAFLEEYNRYWRTYFDPIALRIRMTPQQYRLETIVLPLIDNSIYTSLAAVLGGRPEALDPLPVPKRNIMSIAARLNKESYLPDIRKMESDQSYDQMLRDLGLRGSEANKIRLSEFLSEGLGNQVGFHVYDASPTFDLNMSQVMGMLLGTGLGRRSIGTEELLIGLALTSLNNPVYLSIPVQDAQVVDRFMNALDTALAVSAREKARGGWLSLEQDFYKFPLGQDQIARAFGLRIGPLKLRFFWARIGNGLYLASRPFILEDLAALQQERIRAGQAAEGTATAGQAATALTQDFGPEGHAMARLRPQNWNEVLPDYRLSWAENDREACLNNLGALSGVSRALTARAPGAAADGPTAEALDQLVWQAADRFQGVHLFCPEGGRYVVATDGKTVSCTVHGSALDPRQPSQPTGESATGRLMSELAGATATLKFMPDGLHAVVVIDRK